MSTGFIGVNYQLKGNICVCVHVLYAGICVPMVHMWRLEKIWGVYSLPSILDPDTRWAISLTSIYYWLIIYYLFIYWDNISPNFPDTSLNSFCSTSRLKLSILLSQTPIILGLQSYITRPGKGSILYDKIRLEFMIRNFYFLYAHFILIQYVCLIFISHSYIYKTFHSYICLYKYEN